MEEQTVKRINWKLPVMLTVSVFAVILFLLFGSPKAAAKTITIRTPEDLKEINWSYKGFGPGNKYVIGNDMTLGDADDATVLLTKGSFVIDFNGHTVQNASPSNTVFKVAGANVVMQDSKASNSRPSVRSYGSGAVQIVSGKLTIKNGTYYGASNGQNNPVGLHAGGGTCVVNGGYFVGDYCGMSDMNANLYINGGTIQGGFPFALMQMGSGKIQIANANFISGRTNYGYCFALGAYAPQSYYDFSTWFVNGYSLNPVFQTGYWNMQTQLSSQPFYASVYAVAYNTPTLAVTNTAIAPPKPALTLSNKSTTLYANWKQTARTNGYIVQFCPNSGFKSGVKTVTVKNASTTSATLSGIKANTMYYVRVRSYRSFNGGTFYSGWTYGSYNATAPRMTKLTNTANGVSTAWGKINGAVRYRVFRKIGSGNWTAIANVGNVNSYVDKTAKSGTCYRYTVRAIYKDGKTAASPYNNGKAINYIAMPKVNSVTNSGLRLTIKWNKVAGAAYYRVFYRTAGGKWTKLGDTTGTSLSYTHAAKTSTEFYTVRCMNKNRSAYTSAFDNTGYSFTLTVTNNSPSYYVGSSQSNVYHRPDCASAKNIKAANLIKFSSKADAEKRGYHACSNCKP